MVTTKTCFLWMASVLLACLGTACGDAFEAGVVSPAGFTGKDLDSGRLREPPADTRKPQAREDSGNPIPPDAALETSTSVTCAGTFLYPGDAGSFGSWSLTAIFHVDGSANVSGVARDVNPESCTGNAWYEPNDAGPMWVVSVKVECAARYFWITLDSPRGTVRVFRNGDVNSGEIGRQTTIAASCTVK